MKNKSMPKAAKTGTTADEIAEMATRGEDVSAYFTNKFTVVRPVHRVNPVATLDQGRGRVSAKKRPGGR